LFKFFWNQDFVVLLWTANKSKTAYLKSGLWKSKRHLTKWSKYKQESRLTLSREQPNGDTMRTNSKVQAKGKVQAWTLEFVLSPFIYKLEIDPDKIQSLLNFIQSTSL
jgi:hypothetical protein